MLGQEETFFALFEASADESGNAVDALKKILARGGIRKLDEFVEARRRDKQITEKINEMLVLTFVTPMEREDIEELAEALYKIPKTIEKFAERYLLVTEQIADIDFHPQVALLDKAASLVLQMVRALRRGRDLASIKTLQAELQSVESEADDVFSQNLGRLYQPGFPSLKAVILKDLFDLIEKAVDRCRDAGNVISHVILKNS